MGLANLPSLASTHIPTNISEPMSLSKKVTQSVGGNHNRCRSFPLETCLPHFFVTRARGTNHLLWLWIQNNKIVLVAVETQSDPYQHTVDLVVEILDPIYHQWCRPNDARPNQFIHHPQPTSIYHDPQSTKTKSLVKHPGGGHVSDYPTSSDDCRNHQHGMYKW